MIQEVDDTINVIENETNNEVNTVVSGFPGNKMELMNMDYINLGNNWMRYNK